MLPRALLAGTIAALGLLTGLAEPGAAVESRQPYLFGPPLDDGPVEVLVGFRLTNVNEIDEETSTFQFEGVLSARWQDPRQRFEASEIGAPAKVYQGEYQFSELFEGWWPQIVLTNESGSYVRQGLLLRVEADGWLHYEEVLDATAETPMQLRRFPFDRQSLVADFEILGDDEGKVVLRLDPEADKLAAGGRSIQIPQWRFNGSDVSLIEPTLTDDDGRRPAAAVQLRVEVTRKSGFRLRLVVLPLVILVMLSWSVFWMDRSSLGDRMDISFIGILTVVAYQIVVSEALPRISYWTLLDVFLYVTLLMLAATVVVNLRVSRLDRRGESAAGDRLDAICRWAFPLAYLGLILGSAAFFFLLFD